MFSDEIKRIKPKEKVPAHLLRPGDCFKRYIPYIGTIICKVRFKLKPSSSMRDYYLPVEIIHSVRDDFYHKGQLVELVFKPRNGTFSLVQLVEIKYVKKK